jgi:hypothetical protein
MFRINNLNLNLKKEFKYKIKTMKFFNIKMISFQKNKKVNKIFHFNNLNLNKKVFKYKIKKMKINYKFLIYSLIFSLFISNTLQAQRKNRVTQKADKAFDAEMYFEASELYKKGYKKTKNKAIKAEILFKQAEC